MNTITINQQDLSQTLGLGKPKHAYQKIWTWLILILVALLVAAGIARFQTNSNPPLQFKTVTVELGNLTVTVTATGQLQPVNEVEVGTEVSGTVKSVEVDYNSVVKTGQVLARLDTAKLEGEVAQSQAALELAQAKLMDAEATVEESQKALKRLQQMQTSSSGKLSSQQDLDKAEATLKRAQASKVSAKAQIAEAQAKLKVDDSNLTKAVIRSPIEGIVLERRVEPGQTVAASLQAPILFQLAEDLTQMVLHVNVDEADVGQVKEGQTATFSVDAYPARKYQAKITQVRYAAKVENNVVTYETLLAVANTDLSLRPGMTATAEIVVKRVENALLVANAALRFIPPRRDQTSSKDSGGLVGMLWPRVSNRPAKPPAADDTSKQPQVWSLQAGLPTPILVTVGVSDGRLTEILSGNLKSGQTLLVDVVKAAK